MYEIERNLISLSDEEKIERLEYENNYFYIKIIIGSLQSDELKMSMLEKIHEEDRGKIVTTIKSDDIKLNYITNVDQSISCRYEIALSMKSDELKAATLELFEEYDRQSIILSMKSDKMKIEAMKGYLRFYNYLEIIESLTSIEKKVENLPLLKFPEKMVKVLKNIKLNTDEERIKIAKLIKVDSLAIIFIKEIEDEEKRIVALEGIRDEQPKKDVIVTLSERNRIRCLPKIKSQFLQDRILITIKNEDVKTEYVHETDIEALKYKVILTFDSDEKKIKLLEDVHFNDEEKTAAIIASLSSDSLKLKKLQEIKDEQNITLIKMSLSYREYQKENFLIQRPTYLEIGLDKKITIGIEIESEGYLSEHIKKIDKLLKRNENKETRGWDVKPDGSLYEGVEVTSPILTDNQEDIEDIYMVCTMLQKIENETNERCGGHIHIGSDYLKSKEAFINLFEIWGNAEEIICKISNEKNNIPRFTLQEVAKSISPKMNKAIEEGTINLENEEDLELFIKEIQDIQVNRFSSLNMLNINNGMNTIEFRISNGTLNPDTWIENSRLYGRIVQISQKIAEIEKNPESTKEEKRLVDLKEYLKEEIPEEEKMEILLDLLFEKEERELYRERYFSTIKMLEEVYEGYNPLKYTRFSKVDFKCKKHTLEEFRDLAVKERTSTISEAAKETIREIKEEGNLKDKKDNDMEER